MHLIYMQFQSDTSKVQLVCINRFSVVHVFLAGRYSILRANQLACICMFECMRYIQNSMSRYLQSIFIGRYWISKHNVKQHSNV